DLSVCLSDYAIESWRARPSGKPGGQRTYANIAIEAALTIRMVLHLPLEGFLRSLAEKLEVEIPNPDRTTLLRRLRMLSEIRPRAVSRLPSRKFIRLGAAAPTFFAPSV
ncbi:MAG: transposase, partial [Gemmatimonadota bacterium]